MTGVGGPIMGVLDWALFCIILPKKQKEFIITHIYKYYKEKRQGKERTKTASKSTMMIVTQTTIKPSWV